MYIPVPNHPHLVMLSRDHSAPEGGHIPGSAAARAEVQAALASGDDTEIERVRAKYANAPAPASVQLTRQPLVAPHPHDGDPEVVRLRLARMATGDGARERLAGIVSLSKAAPEREIPSPNAPLADLLKLIGDADPNFARLSTPDQHARVQQLRSALRPFVGSVAASRIRASAKPVLLLSLFAGRNNVERCVWMLRANDPDFGKKSWEAQCKTAAATVDFFDGRIL
jgi:hypothetical protein